MKWISRIVLFVLLMAVSASGQSETPVAKTEATDIPQPPTVAQKNTNQTEDNLERQH